MAGIEFYLGYLETMSMVTNFGTHWGIVHTDGDDEQPYEQLEQ